VIVTLLYEGKCLTLRTFQRVCAYRMRPKENISLDRLTGLISGMIPYMGDHWEELSIENPAFWALSYFVGREREIEELSLSKELLEEFAVKQWRKILVSAPTLVQRTALEKFYSYLQQVPNSKMVVLESGVPQSMTVQDIMAGLEYRGNNDSSLDKLPSALALAKF
jgi:hypothetical protein